MNTIHESKITHSFVSKLTNSGAIARVCRLGFGDFESHACHPDLISTSLGGSTIVFYFAESVPSKPLLLNSAGGSYA